MLNPMRRLATTMCIALGFVLAPAAHAQTTLEFPTWQAEEPGVSTWWKELIAAYEKRYPDVKINLQQVPFAQFVKQMTVRFAAERYGISLTTAACGRSGRQLHAHHEWCAAEIRAAPQLAAVGCIGRHPSSG